MITDAERHRIRDLARQVAQDAPPPAGNQLALVTSLLGPATAQAAAQRKTQEDSAARGAA